MRRTGQPLVQRCQSAFSQATRQRGRNYAQQKRVKILTPTFREVRAEVRGSYRNRYEVTISWMFAEYGDLGVNCTCPLFQDDAVPCKHLFATLLVLDAKGYSSEVKGKGPLALYFKIPEEDEDYDELFEEAPNATLPAPPNWQLWLDLIRRQVPGEPATTTARRRAWFGLELPPPADNRGQLRIAFYRQDQLKNGGFGKLKPSSLNAAELALFEPEERPLMHRLLELGHGDWTGLVSGSSYYDGDPRRRSVPLRPALFELFLPDLCQSGRLFWLSDLRDQPTSLTYDPSSPWRLELHGEDQRSTVRFSGRLVRDRPAASAESAEAEKTAETAAEPKRSADEKGHDEKGHDEEGHDEGRREVVSLDEPRVTFRNGWIFFADHIGRLIDSEDIFPWLSGLLREPEPEIPREEVAEALTEMARLPGLPPVRLPQSLDWPEVTVEPEPVLLIHFDAPHILARPTFAYGEKRLDPADPASGWADQVQKKMVRRNVEAEAAWIGQLDALEVARDSESRGWQLGVDEFVTVATDLQQRGWRLEADGHRIHADGTFSGNVSSGVDWFELTGSMTFGEQHVDLPALLAAARKRQSYVVLGDGTFGLLPREWLERFTPLAQVLDAGDAKGSDLRFEKHQAFVLDALLAAEPAVEVDEVFARIRQQLRSFEGLEPGVAPETFEGTLRPYQEQGLAWMSWLAELGLGGCLADDMGLGKTIQVLAFLEQRRLQSASGELEDREAKDEEAKDRRSLLVVPRSLLHNWISEAARFTPALPTQLYHGSGRKKALSARPAGEPTVVITTYGTLRRDIAALREIDFDVVVLDEAQAVKNHKSQTAKACRLVHGRHRLALTGTPVENHIGELWSLFEILNPGMLGRLPALASMAGKTQLPPASIELVARAIRPLVLRRSKSQVLKDLPAKTEQTLHCELSTKERKRYDELLGHYRSRLLEKVDTVGLGRSKIMVLEALLRLRQAACHAGLIDQELRNEPSAKVELLIDRLKEVVGEGDKALVFSQFTRFLAIVRERLDREGIVYEYLDGRTQNRQAKVDRFQEDQECPVFLISLKAGGVGLNLTAASYVFLLDPWWNPAVEAQAIDRVHRIGQDQPVFAYRLIASDTVEEKILELQASKRELADAIVAQDQRVLRQLTAEDLSLLLGGPLEKKSRR